MLPGRSSDAGPDSRKHCPTCGSSKWNVLGMCFDCGTTVCDCCPGAAVDTAGLRQKIRCHDCEMDRQRELYTGEVDDDLECGCRFTGDQADASECRLHQITARVKYASLPEWEANQDVTF